MIRSFQIAPRRHVHFWRLCRRPSTRFGFRKWAMRDNPHFARTAFQLDILGLTLGMTLHRRTDYRAPPREPEAIDIDAEWNRLMEERTA